MAELDRVHVPPGAQADLMGRADMVVVCLPLTSETLGAIGEVGLRRMKRSAYLIAVGRGRVIDKAAGYYC